MDNKKQRLKNRTPLSNAVENKLFEGLQKLSKTTRIPISKLLDEAIEDLLKKYNKEQYTCLQREESRV